MDTEEQTHQSPGSRQKSPHSRPNFSDCGRVCDQNFYLLVPHRKKSPPVEIPAQKQKPKESTYGFSSVPRQKRGNYRLSICLPEGQFSYYPNHNYGKSTSPKWSFSKDEKYEDNKIVEYELCRKHPLIKTKAQKMYSSTSSMRQTMKDPVKSMKHTFMQQTAHTKPRNYSIINGRQTSPVGFYQKTKIKDKFYLTREEIMEGEQELEKEEQKKKQNIPSPEGYIKFHQKRARHPNKIMKGFEEYLPNYEHEHQFNNYSEVEHPTKPQYHINFNKHLQRPSFYRQRYGPNPIKPNINSVRINKSNIDLHTKKFRDKIKTRYDRIQPEPNTRLNYSLKEPSLGGMVKMSKVIDRNAELFPIVDPIIKKAGDDEMKQRLRKSVPVKEINEAWRPKCAQKVKL